MAFVSIFYKEILMNRLRFISVSNASQSQSDSQIDSKAEVQCDISTNESMEAQRNTIERYVFPEINKNPFPKRTALNSENCSSSRESYEITFRLMPNQSSSSAKKSYLVYPGNSYRGDVYPCENQEASIEMPPSHHLKSQLAQNLVSMSFSNRNSESISESMPHECSALTPLKDDIQQLFDSNIEREASEQNDGEVNRMNYEKVLSNNRKKIPLKKYSTTGSSLTSIQNNQN